MDLDPSSIELMRPAMGYAGASSAHHGAAMSSAEELEAFLANEQKQILHDAVFEANQLVVDEFDCAFATLDNEQWEELKPRVLRAFHFEAGSYDPEASVTAQASAPAAPLPNGMGLPAALPPRHAQGRSVVRSTRSVEFSGALSRLWSARAASGGGGGGGGVGVGVGVGAPFDLMGAWLAVSKSPAAALEGASTKLGNCWRLCHRMAASAKPFVDSGAEATASGALALRIAMLDGAIAHLGTQQQELLQAQLLEQPEAAMRGGMPGTEYLAAAKLTLDSSGGYVVGDAADAVELDSGKAAPLWPTVYWCLRCGDRAAAVRVMQRASAAQVGSPASWKGLLALIVGLEASTARDVAGGDGGHLSQLIRAAQLEYWSNGAATNEALSVVYSVLCAPMENVSAASPRAIPRAPLAPPRAPRHLPGGQTPIDPRFALASFCPRPTWTSCTPLSPSLEPSSAPLAAPSLRPLPPAPCRPNSRS